VSVPIAEIFFTTTYATTHCKLGVTLGSGGTHSVTVDVAGNGYTSSEAWSSSVSWPATDSKSLVLLRNVVLTGTYDMTAAKVIDVRVRLWTNEYPPIYDQPENPTSVSDPNYAGINTNVNGINEGKGMLCPNIEPNMQLWVYPFKIEKTGSSSLTFSLGASVSFGIPNTPVSFKVSSTFSSGASSSNAIFAHVWNTDTYAHTYKWYLEGESLYGGVALHVWDMGRT